MKKITAVTLLLLTLGFNAAAAQAPISIASQDEPYPTCDPNKQCKPLALAGHDEPYPTCDPNKQCKP